MLESQSGGSSVTSGSTYHDRRNAFLCGLLVVLAISLSWPFAEIGRNDDWSYAQSTLALLHSGKLVYNGWSTATLGALAFWGAAIIKLAGFSFTALRLSVWPFSGLTAAIVYLLARRLDASASIAAMAALTVGLSQLAIECGATFSTDIPALFCLTFTLHQLARSLDRERLRPSQIFVPLLLASTVGYAGGSIRQVYWLMPMIGLPYVAWVRRKERANASIAIALLAVVVICVLETEAWSHAQPYFIPEYFHATAVVFFDKFPWTLEPTITLAMTLTLFTLPMIVGTWPVLKQPGDLLLQCFGVVVGAGVIWCLGDAGLAPWLGDLVTQYGIMHRGQDAIGDQPQVIPDAIRLVLTLICAAAAARMIWAILRSTPRVAKKIVDSELPHILWLTGLFAVPYSALILFRGPAFSMIDRYALPLMVIICLWLAKLSQRRRFMSPTLTGWSLLIFFALFGIAVTHDEFAEARARVRATNTLTNHGIRRNSITAGLDYDAWTQLQEVGYLNDGRIINPPNTFVPHPRSVPQGRTDYWFWEWTPIVRPDYFVVDTPQLDLDNPDGMVFRYRAWLPPFDRAVYVQKRPSGWIVGW